MLLERAVPSVIRCGLLCVAVALATASSAVPEDLAAAAPVEDERKLVVHGFLSQAFAISDRHQVLGIPKDGTFDYRTAALQFRAAISAQDSFVIQLSQERLGESPVMKVRNAIDLDWIFYEHTFGTGVGVRVGRVKIPIGIYNEIRFVGPLLPFFRAADVFYGEGSFAFDSVDGAMLSKTFFAAREFSLDADVYGGQWSFLQNDGATRAQAKKGLGGQLWLNTPLRGLRFGLGGNRSTWSNSITAPPGTRVPHDKWFASADGNFERFRLSAEMERDSFPQGLFAASYALLSVHATRRASVNLQVTQAHLRLDAAHYDEDLDRDYAVGLSFAFRPDVVVKVENHWITGRTFEEAGVTVFTPALRTDYVIVSLSTLF